MKNLAILFFVSALAAGCGGTHAQRRSTICGAASAACALVSAYCASASPAADAGAGEE